MATRDAEARTEAGPTDVPATLPADDVPLEHDEPAPRGPRPALAAGRTGSSSSGWRSGSWSSTS